MKKQTFTLPIFKALALCTFILFSTWSAHAQHFYFGTNSQALHFLYQKGDGSLIFGLPRVSDQYGIEVQGGYALSKHISGFGNFLSSGYNSIKKQKNVGAHLWIAEGGIGFHQKNPRGVAQLLIGTGYASVYNYYELDRGTKLRFSRSFIQPSILFDRSENVIGAISLRFTQLRLLGGNVDASITEQELNYIRNIEDKTNFYIPEFGFMMGLRFNPCTMRLHFNGFFTPTQSYRFSRNMVSFVFGYEFGKKKK
jgi:hypothetical protein